MPQHWPLGQASFSIRLAPHNAGAGWKKTARLKGCIAPLRMELVENTPHPAQPYEGRQGMDCSLRFATSKPDLAQEQRHHSARSPEKSKPAADRPPPWGIGRTAGATLRDALQPPRLVWEGLEGATRPSMSMLVASKGLAIGWGAASRRSHANLVTVGEEFA
jgi:hypothetical protein